MTGIRPSKLLVLLLLLWFVSMAALAAQPVITGVTIPNASMKINDIVTVTISVQSDSATIISHHELSRVDCQSNSYYNR